MRSLVRLQCPDSEIEIDWVTHLKKGPQRSAWAADVEVRPDPHGLSGRKVAHVPPHPMDVGDEVRWLAFLQRCDLPFTTPRPLGATRDGILVLEQLDGVAGDRMRWKDCVRAAAALHTCGFASDRRAFADAQLEPLRASTDPVVRAAVDWCESNMPTGPLVVTHGNLLPKKMLHAPGRRVGVIDWQFAGPGDPAQELAALTRGVKRPFRLSDGLATVVRCYLEEGGRPISIQQVHFYELCMLATQVEDGRKESCSRLRSCLSRVASPQGESRRS